MNDAPYLVNFWGGLLLGTLLGLSLVWRMFRVWRPLTAEDWRKAIRCAINGHRDDYPDIWRRQCKRCGRLQHRYPGERSVWRKGWGTPRHNATRPRTEEPHQTLDHGKEEESP